MPRIQRLPQLLVDQIAAGEVIERPANIIKELVENSIDAGSSRIRIETSGGGRDLVHVVDDGCGISADDLPLAIESHATSKIIQVEDLDSIGTMGFRGEALASIGAVSHLSVRSRTAEDDAASLLRVVGGDANPVEPAAGAPGTSVSVEHLFFNTPGRRKFLKTDRAENGRIAETVRSIAMAHPSIGFTLVTDGRTVLELSPTSQPSRRVIDILGKEFQEQLIEVSFDAPSEGIPGGPSVWGLLGTPAIARGNWRNTRFYLNGRLIQDASLQHALKESYRGLVEPGRCPTAALFLELDPRQVDVNVHPTKIQVRFRDPQLMHRVVRRVAAKALDQRDLVAPMPLNQPSYGHRPDYGSGSGTTRSIPTPTSTTASPGIEYATLAEQVGPAVVAPIDPEQSIPMARKASRVLQVHRKYLVVEDEQGMLLIDQHALHERILFEKLKQRVEESDMDIQRMLVPAAVQTDQAGLEVLDQLQPVLQRLGIEVSPIGPDTLGVHCFPVLLLERKVEPGPFVESMLQSFASGIGLGEEAVLSEVLDMMACKAAIKAGDSLTDREIAELLQQRELVERSSRCPHGRPTTLRIGIDELDKRFERR
ncbi:MAG: DNA mismatch repair protein MutL [Phycisphaerae bacterium]|nr:DNA mismatch repair protein MutL [Phycisphaerae bacterium]